MEGADALRLAGDGGHALDRRTTRSPSKIGKQLNKIPRPELSKRSNHAFLGKTPGFKNSGKIFTVKIEIGIDAQNIIKPLRVGSQMPKSKE